MALEGGLSLAVRHMDEVLWARQEVKRFAAALPFSPEDLARLDVSASELASNMVKHAGGGRLLVTLLEREGRRGVRMVAEDHGPGIPDITAALKPGFSTSGTLGTGLGAVREFMDKLEICSEPGQGTRVEVEKWVR